MIDIVIIQSVVDLLILILLLREVISKKNIVKSIRILENRIDYVSGSPERIRQIRKEKEDSSYRFLTGGYQPKKFQKKSKKDVIPPKAGTGEVNKQRRKS